MSERGRDRAKGSDRGTRQKEGGRETKTHTERQIFRGRGRRWPRQEGRGRGYRCPAV